MQLLSPVLSARVALKPSAKVRLLFGGKYLPLRISASDPTFCAAYNETNRSWDESVCNTSVFGRITLCHCSTAVNLALLHDLDAQKALDEHHWRIVILCYCCILPSIIAITVTLMVYGSLEFGIASLQNVDRTASATIEHCFIITCLSIFLLVTQFIFLYIHFLFFQFDVTVGILHFYCTAFSNFAYYFVSVVCMTEGFHIIRSLIHQFFNPGIDVANVPVSCFAKYRKLFRAVFIIVISALSLLLIIHICFSTVHPKFSSFKRTLFFPVAGPSSLIVLGLPLAVCFILLTAIFIFLLYVHFFRVTLLSAEQKSDARSRTLGLGVLCISVSTTYAFGFLQSGPHWQIMNYLFVVSNGILGVLTFVIFCLFRKEIRTHMFLIFKCRRNTAEMANGYEGNPGVSLNNEESDPLVVDSNI